MRELTLGDEDGVFQVGGRRVVVEHLVGHKDDEAEAENKIDLREVQPTDTTTGLCFTGKNPVKKKAIPIQTFKPHPSKMDTRQFSTNQATLNLNSASVVLSPKQIEFE